ncbi:substrate-binding domain-containing protein [Cryobacterium sp. Y62]|uniref:substrate-binding domain-containing protein n=1 Tax=Cryobacterium sp. Y62 TaxID=2048284 RepID=UPI0011AFDD16|nr:substrate-binding domain-containing protein [Cryobacterium sp. Y62]
MAPNSRLHRRAMMLGAAAAAFTMLMAGCSSSDTGGNGAGTAIQVNTDFEYDEAQVQELVNLAFGVDTPMAGLPDEAVEGFARATLELTPDQIQTALDCWKKPECTIGDGPVHLGIFNAVDNLWQTTAVMDVILQALTYPEVGKISYSFVADLPSAQAAVRSLAADGANIIIGYNAFGAAMAPVFTEAQAAGAVIATYTGETPDVDGSVINNQVYAQACDAGTGMSNVMVNDLGLTSTNELAFLFGTPGNPQDTLVTGCLQESLTKLDGPTIGFQQDTDWSRPGVASAAAALIASGVPAKAVLNTYADPIPQLISAYDQAGVQVPSILTWTEMNELFGIWEERAGTAKEFDLYYTNALVNQARLALTNAMSILAGEDVPDRTPLPLPIIKAKAGVYEADLPGDFPGWSALIPEDVMSGMLK